MSNSLPILSPTVGNGLGGIPKRKGGGNSKPRGEAVFTKPGSYLWTVPKGVTEVCAVCIGAGGYGAYDYVDDPDSSSYYRHIAMSGGGGGLGWKNKIKVKEGQVLEVFVGDSISTYTSSDPKIKNVEPSYVRYDGESDYIVAGLGGFACTRLQYSYDARDHGFLLEGGGFIGDGGGIGGAGITNNYRHSSTSSRPDMRSSGGGAGGYSGNGGQGVTLTGNYDEEYYVLGEDGSGGGAGGSVKGRYAFRENQPTAFTGGGVDIYGEGESGVSTPDSELSGGSGGEPSTCIRSDLSMYERHQFEVPLYGGGGSVTTENISSTSFDYTGPIAGGHGAVRILWGEGRAFPSTDVGRG